MKCVTAEMPRRSLETGGEHLVKHGCQKKLSSIQKIVAGSKIKAKHRLMQVTSGKSSALYLSFNQDGSCITVGTNRGFRVFNTVPFRPLYGRDFPDGCSVVSMLFRSSILAIVGTGVNSRYPKDAVTVYDDQSGRTIGEVNFRTPVLNTYMTREKIFIIFENKVFVYNLSDMRLLDSFDTYPNPHGIFSVVGDTDVMIATLGLRIGEVMIKRYSASMNATYVLNVCHENDIRCLNFSLDGRFIATASTKGTLIRVWTTDSFQKVKEVRRGSEKADIQSIAFSLDSSIIAVTSSRKTLHAFYVLQPAQMAYGMQPQVADNKKHKMQFMATINKYFDSEWSFAKISLDDSVSLCRFITNDCIIVICGDGSYYKLRIANNAIEKENFLNMLTD